MFQRTPNFSAPAWNGPLDPETAREVVDGFDERRRAIRESVTSLHYPANDKGALEVSDEERERELEARYEAGGLSMVGVFTDVMIDPAANEHVAEFFRRKIRARVDDPAVAEALIPRSHPWGTKRPCVDTEYYETFNRDDVTLVDLRRGGIIGGYRFCCGACCWPGRFSFVSAFTGIAATGLRFSGRPRPAP